MIPGGSDWYAWCCMVRMRKVLGRSMVLVAAIASAVSFIALDGWSANASAASGARTKAAGTQRLSCTGTIQDASGSSPAPWNLGLAIDDPQVESLQQLSRAETRQRVRVRFFSPYPIKLLGTSMGTEGEAADSIAISGFTAKYRFTIRVPVSALGKVGTVEGVNGAWVSNAGSEAASFTCTSTLERD